MREEIWTEKIFKDDAGYFLRITNIFLYVCPTESEDALFEQPEEFCIYLVAYFTEIIRSALELQTIHIQNEKTVLIVFYPILVSFVEPGDIVYSDALLIVPAPFLNLAHEVRD